MKQDKEKQITITVNGQKIATAEGNTILETVRQHKLDEIPTLCHDDRIEPYGSCFLCVVEVKGMNRLVASCCTPATEGMEIETDNPRIRSSRKTSLELLLSNHYADCIGPCNNKCPAGVDAQGYIALMSQGKYDAALKLIKQRNPLPLSIGRVCVRDCETACRRQLLDEPVAINHLKRYTADLDALKEHLWTPGLKDPNGKRVAVIGGGPAGLSCAYYLTLEGYKVTIFEKQPRLGGMLMYGIPEYRLPKDILDREINWITGLGVDVETGKAMGRDFDLSSLSKEGYDAIFLAVGAHKASAMRLEDENDTEGVLGGIEFLRNFSDGPVWVNGRVVVVGGGNTAIDAARTALRCGAEEVSIVYRRSIKEMPAHDEEIHAALDEGIDICFLNNPTQIVKDNQNRLRGIVCVQMELKEAGPGQRPRPVPVEGSEFFMPCDLLISAIGQAVDTSFNGSASGSLNGSLNESSPGVQLEQWGTVITDPDSLVTSIEGVFAGGDAVTGPDTAINAIAQGKQAARSIEAYLDSKKTAAVGKPFLSFKHRFAEISENELSHIPPAPRNKMPELPMTERTGTFCEVEKGYTPGQVKSEVLRCLECGCSEYSECQLRLYADQYGAEITPFLGETRKYTVDARHPFIKLDPNKCINCGRCVRTCAEILDVSALGFVHRGFKAVVKPAMEKALADTNCIACGNCIDTCPTGALSEKFPFKVLGTLPKENHESVCNFCSIGCKINVKVIHDDMFYVANTPGSLENSHNNGYLCTRGRFGHRFLSNNPERLTRPWIKENGIHRQAEWLEAIDTLVNRLQEVIREHGPDAVAITGSPKMSNEELYLLQKLARVGLKTNNTGSFSQLLYSPSQSGLDGALGVTTSTATLEDIAGADVVVVVNGNLTPQNLVMELKIKEARKKNNAHFVLFNSAEIPATHWADLWVDSRKGSNTALLNGVIREIIAAGSFDPEMKNTPGFRELQDAVKEFTPETVCEASGITPGKYRQLLELVTPTDQKTVFIYNIDASGEKSPGDLEAIGNLLLLSGRMRKDNTNGGVIVMRQHVNSAGLLEMGVHPGFLPGYVKPFETGAIETVANAWNTGLTDIFTPEQEPLTQKLLQGKIKALLVFGEDPLAAGENRKYFNHLEFLAVHDLFRTTTTAEADIIIPASSFLEQEGSYISCDRRMQHTRPALPPKVDIPTWKFIRTLANHFDMKDQYASIAEVSREIRGVNRLFKPERQTGGFLENPLKSGCFNHEGQQVFQVTPKEDHSHRPEPQPLTYGETYSRIMQMSLELRN